MSERPRDVVAYRLTSSVVPSIRMQPVTAVIAHCGQSLSAGYIIDFTNPGGASSQNAEVRQVDCNRVRFSVAGGHVASSAFSSCACVRTFKIRNGLRSVGCERRPWQPCGKGASMGFARVLMGSDEQAVQRSLPPC